MKNRFFFSLILFLQGMGSFAQQSLPFSAAFTEQSAFSNNTSGLFINFSVTIQEQNKIRLQWKTDSLQGSDYFIVEHSSDGNKFETFGAIKVDHRVADYEITDNAPYAGTNFYRIKYSDTDGHIVYSKIMEASLSEGSSFRFYPNPVDKLLIVQTDRSIDLQILNSEGNTLISKEMQPGMNIITVSSLQKGNYFMHVVDKTTQTERTLQLLKN